MDALHEMQKDLHKHIRNSYTNFKKKGAQNMSKVNARARLNGLEHWYSQYEANHAKIINAVGDQRNHEYFKTNLSEQITDDYFDRKGEFAQFIEDAEQLEAERNPPPSPSQAVIPVRQMAAIDQHSLPKVNIPKFTGQQSQWENFRDLFRSIVHRRADLDSSVKYVYLRSHISGEALERIKSIPIAAEHYERAWSSLVKHYDNKRRTVNNLILKLFNVQPMKAESASELQRVYMEVSGPLESLKSLGRNSEQIGNDLIVHLFVKQFDANTKKDWKKSIDKDDDAPSSVDQIKEFIESQLENLESPEDSRDQTQSQNSNGKAKSKAKSGSRADNESQTAHALQTSNKDSSLRAFKCSFCGADHQTSKCDQFLKKSVSERQQVAKANRLCFNCLGTKHSTKQCKSKYSCFNCKARHHTLLHYEKTDTSANSDSNSAVQSASLVPEVTANVASNPSSHSTQSMGSSGVLLATAQINIFGPKNKSVIVRALLDSCSQVSLVTQSLCNRLALAQSDTHVCIQGVGDKGALIARKLARFSLKPHFESRFQLEVEALVLPKLSSYKPPSVSNNTDFNHLKGLNVADPTYTQDARIDVLLGANVYASIIQEGIVKGPINQPIALNSRLGWLITGSIPSTKESRPAVLHCACEAKESAKLSDLLEGFWRTEDVGIKNPLSPADQKCEEFYSRTTTRDPSGRYVVKLPWKEPEKLPDIPMGSSFHQAFHALKRLEANFAKDAKLREAYHKFMREYLELGHMVEVVGEKPSPNSNFYFLPHHGVWKDSSATTKLRTVFNGSAKLSTGKSLNDLLYIGRNLLKSPVELICKVRNFKIALSADIEKMYRQIRVHEDDKRYQTILWRFEPQQSVSVFLLNTVTYGLAPSAFLAIRSLVQLASDHKDDHPIASAVIRNEMYSDNVLTGAHTTQEAMAKIMDLLALLRKGQMNLRKWSSNDQKSLSNLPPEMLITDEISLFSNDTAVPILGIAWHTVSDCFLFQLQQVTLQSPVTKRVVLSRIARIFDPLGWIGPVIIQAKILMQSLWLLKLGWDEALPEHVTGKWSAWISDLPSISEIRIPRWTGFTPDTMLIEIHGFADASKFAYGAVLYLRLADAFGVTTSLQLAKSKVSPIKTLSVPRLELCAAVLLSRIVKQFLDSSALVVGDVHLWTDSADVLYWLKDHPSRWNVFVSNRCSEIHTSVPHAYWHHVKSKDNPADVLSRGLAPSALKDHDLWWSGPKFLTNTSDSWSKQQDELNFSVKNIISASAHKITFVHASTDSPPIWDLINKYSTLEKLSRITAYCLRFISKIIRKISSRETRKFQVIHTSYFRLDLILSSLCVSAQEIESAQRFWMYLVQIAYLKSEHTLLSAGKRLSGNNALVCLNPIIHDHLIRVGGRLSNQLSNDAAKHPVILPHSSPLNPLLIMQAHLRTLHGGTQLTLATLRQQVWILRARTEVRKIVRSCLQCARYAAVTPTQLMGDLPTARVCPSPPFQSTGVDYAGPISVRLTKARGRGTLKGYVCVFVCMATRAVHLELVEDYTSEAFVAAFHRFTARRGHCKFLFSDKGTNFVGADSQLAQMLAESSAFYACVTPRLADEGTTWSFNPPSAPHFGGLWEAAVKSMKHHLRRVIGEQVLTFSELSTLLCKVEACLNSRPLVALSDDATDLKFLSPAHFLIQRDSFLVPESDITSCKIPLGRRWKHITQLSQHFWARWSKEYLSALQKRNKWLHPQQVPAIGDLVLVKQENAPPGKWPMGKIVSLHPGSDGLSRVVTIRTSTGTLKRPIVKLVKLPVASENKMINSHFVSNSSIGDEGGRNVA